jgi:hypothetical protein
LLAIPFQSPVWKSWTLNGERYFGVSGKNENQYLITSADCGSLHRIESGSKRKRKVTIEFNGIDRKNPEIISLQHHTFAMKINLKKLRK